MLAVANMNISRAFDELLTGAVDILAPAGIDCRLPIWPSAPRRNIASHESRTATRQYAARKSLARMLAGQATATELANFYRRGSKPMRRAGQKRIVTSPATQATPPPNESGSLVVELDVPVGRPTSAESVAEPAKSPRGSIVGDAAADIDTQARRRRNLAAAIRKRIESRLSGRVRDLIVRVHEDRVVLEGECATYYTKQLAQHAALGILEDEHLENAIVVDVPQ